MPKGHIANFVPDLPLPRANRWNSQLQNKNKARCRHELRSEFGHFLGQTPGTRLFNYPALDLLVINFVPDLAGNHERSEYISVCTAHLPRVSEFAQGQNKF